MRALSFHQPHGSLLVTGAKPFETRNRATKVRGEVLLHAAGRYVERDMAMFLRDARYRMGLAPLIGQPMVWRDSWDFEATPFPIIDEAETPFVIPVDALAFGAFVGIGELVNCIPTEEISKEQRIRSRGFGDFTAGRYAWEFANVRRFSTPIPARGKQGFWFAGVDLTDVEQIPV